MPDDDIDLRRLARRIFAETLDELDAGRAVRRAVSFDGARLKICGEEFNVGGRAFDVYSVALGKAAGAMAMALDEIMGERLSGGVVSAPPLKFPLPTHWQVFAGGHPLPNAASVQAARAAFDLLRRADEQAATGARDTLVVFLVSGGGSALLELPRDASVTLEDLRAMNGALVACGASVVEINAVRSAVSAVKGGGLCRAAPRAAQISLIVSDVNDGEAQAVASGPTFPVDDEVNAREARSVIGRYDLAGRLPDPVLRVLKRTRAQLTPEGGVKVDGRETGAGESAVRRHFVLLDNARAVERAAEIARASGFAVEVADDLVEQNVEDGARLLVSRLMELRGRVGVGRGVCLISGGEFACPVRGAGVGGRNSETGLRCALELDARVLAFGAGSNESDQASPRVVALSAGTDGIDGNSPAAGALCDETTIARARALGLDARKFLDASDAYTFFASLDDAITIGATGTNVRDLRILLAKDEG